MTGFTTSIATLRIPIIGRVLRNVRPVTPPPDPPDPMSTQGAFSSAFSSAFDVRRRS